MQQQLLETEELRTKLDIIQQRLREADEYRVAFENALEEQLKSEALMISISARFVNLPADRIDSEIEDTQRRICELLDLDRSTLWQFVEAEPEVLLLTHFHQIPKNQQPAKRVIARNFFPWSVQKVLSGETVSISKMNGLPPEAEQDRENYNLYGTRSTVLVPLSVGKGPVFGLLSFAAMRQERDWPDTVVGRFVLISQVFANALARKQADKALRESEMRLNMATTAAGAGIWIMEPDTGYIWVTPKIRELFHFDPGEVLSYESFLKTTHPDDRDQLNQTVLKAIRSGENFRFDYRIILPDGNIRWIGSIGQRHIGSAGESDRFMGVSLDITERRLSELALEERLRFETLLTEISARFVNLPADRLDSELEDAERRICELLGLDLAALWQWSDNVSNLFTLTHIYSVQGGPQPSDVNEAHFPWFIQQIRSGRIVAFSSLEELPAEAALDRESCRLFGVKSNLTFPLSVGGAPPIGILGLNTTRAERDWPDALVKRLQLVAQLFANALARKQADTERKRMEDQLLERLQEIEALKYRLESENIYLREEVRHLVAHADIVGQSAAMQKVLAEAEQVAGTDSTVLLLGETGTGKELLARAIHRMSLRKDRPLITVNCAALPPTLIESELFGREKGAYTGAMTRMTGRFEIADGSTLFLDEIGELPLDLQSKLLRVLEEGTFERLGSTTPLHVDVRIIAATNRNMSRK